MEIYDCTRLRARISKRQCEINRNGYRMKGTTVLAITTCQGCAGLGGPVHVSLPIQETKKMAKHRCNKTGCDRAVKNAGDFCWQHKGLADQVAAGAVNTDHPEDKLDMVTLHHEGEGSVGAQVATPVTRVTEIEAGSICAVCVGDCNAGPTPCQPGTLTDCVNFVPWRRNDERTQAMLSLVGCTVSLEMLKQQSDQDLMAAEFYAGALHLQASDNEDVQIPSMPFFLKGTQTAAPANIEISPVASHPAQEPTDSCVEPSSPATEGTKGLAALLRAPAPLPVGLFVPFALEELAALVDSEVTPEVIREFVIMGLEGKLQPIADAAA